MQIGCKSSVQHLLQHISFAIHQPLQITAIVLLMVIVLDMITMMMQ